MIGKTISHYKILEKLGEGGMGVVYKAEDTKLKREVALKFLPTNALQGPAEKERFTREAQAAAKLHHTNIVAAHAEGEDNGVCYYAKWIVEVADVFDAGRPCCSERKNKVRFVHPISSLWRGNRRWRTYSRTAVPRRRSRLRPARCEWTFRPRAWGSIDRARDGMPNRRYPYQTLAVDGNTASRSYLNFLIGTARGARGMILPFRLTEHRANSTSYVLGPMAQFE